MELVGVALGNGGQEQRHGVGVDPWQHETVHDAIVWTHGRKSVEELALQPRADRRTYVLGRPAAPGPTQQAEAPLVLEHDSHAASLLGVATDLATHEPA